jgi:hypothetical protein
MLSVLVFFLIAPLGYLLLLLGNPGKIVATAPLGGYLPPTLPLVLGLTSGISIYLYFSSVPYKKIRDRVKEMEQEFADSLFVLGRRISEGKAPEEAFAYTSKTMEGSKIGKAFEEISMNLLSTVLHQLDPKIIYPHYDFKHLTEKYFEIGMKLDDFLIQLVKYCQYEDKSQGCDF